jgi:hypothetical protein
LRKFSDPAKKQKSLERLLAWKEARRKAKEAEIDRRFDIIII